MNIIDIANEANVSTATVSRVLNDHRSVRADTKARVEDVIRRHGYTPNALARGLIRNKTRTIGVLTVDILNPYYATVVHSLERNMNALGYNTLLCNTGGSHKEKLRYVRTLLEQRTDAIVFVGSIYANEEDHDIVLDTTRTVPVVTVNSRLEMAGAFSVVCDDRVGVAEATQHLLSQGRQSILLVNTEETESARIKERAFKAVLRERREVESSVIETSDERLFDLEIKLAHELRPHKYDAVLATDDLFANVVVKVLHRLSAAIPREVAVIGYNNSRVSEYTYPRLTSVDSHMAEIGERCTEVLDTVLSGGTPPTLTTVRPHLVIKDSA